MTYYEHGADELTYWRLTRDGERFLRRESERLSFPKQRKFSVYFELADGEREGLARVASKRFGQTGFALLDPELTRISHRIQRPEIAFTIHASSQEEAITNARDVFGDLQHTAGLPIRSPELALLVDVTGSL
jgi:hypothetical protein